MVYVVRGVGFIVENFQNTKVERIAQRNLTYLLPSYNNYHFTLVGMAQWIELPACEPKDRGLIPGQGTCLGCRPGPQQGPYEKQSHVDVSLPPFPSLK